MKQETITGVQKATGLLFVGSGPLVWVAQNATVITALTTVVTGLIFAGCAIWNALSNHRRNSINKRDIIESIIIDIDEDDLTDKEIKKFKKSLRKH
jgi:hypothetical protein